MSESADDHGQNGFRSKSLYMSHFISTWNSRGFEFGAVLFLAAIYPGTLLPLSVYALIRSLAAIALSPQIGKYIDRSNRLEVVHLSIVGQRLAVVVSCAAFLGLIILKDTLSRFLSMALFLLLMFLACTEKLCAIMNTIAVERDWVVVIALENEPLLREMNSQMRRIDLSCKLISPLAIALIDGISTSLAVTVTLVVNLTSVVAEYLLIAWVYRRTPSLSNRDTVPSPVDTNESHRWWSLQHLRGSSTSIIRQAKAYINSHAFLPSLSLSILYLTVLSFSGQMVTYLFSLEQPRLNSTHIGLLRTIATVLEISSTFIAPVLITRLGAVRAGIWSLSWLHDK